MMLTCQGTPSQCPPLHPLLSFMSLNIVEKLKLSKSGKTFKCDLTIIDFDNIDVCEVKYLPSKADGDMLFVLSHMTMGVPSVYGRSMNGMDKMCNGHL